MFATLVISWKVLESPVRWIVISIQAACCVLCEAPHLVEMHCAERHILTHIANLAQTIMVKTSSC